MESLKKPSLFEESPVNTKTADIGAKPQQIQGSVKKNVNLAFSLKPMPDKKYRILLDTAVGLPDIAAYIINESNHQHTTKDEILKGYREDIISWLESIMMIKEYLKPNFIKETESCLSSVQYGKLSCEKFEDFISSLKKELEFQRKKIIGEEDQESKKPGKSGSSKTLTTSAKKAQVQAVQARNEEMMAKYREEYDIRD